MIGAIRILIVSKNFRFFWLDHLNRDYLNLTLVELLYK
jgi:hypothetical protein